MLFAPKNAYAPCGVYTKGHFISALICFFAVALIVFLMRRARIDKIYDLIKILAVALSTLELVKIGHNFYYGYTNPDSWVPLSFCSLFIYACYLSGYGRGRARDMGNAFSVIGGIVAGAVFICMPTTSLTMYPLFHYQSLYSLLFHSCMIAVGILLLRAGVRPTANLFKSYLIYFSLFAGVALALNLAVGSNLMTLREPYKLPFDFLHVLNERAPLAYTVLAVAAHVALPYPLSCAVYRLLHIGNGEKIKDLRALFG